MIRYGTIRLLYVRWHVVIRYYAVIVAVRHAMLWHDTIPACETNTPFGWAFALQSSRNSTPAPALLLWKLIFQRVLFSGGVFFHRHRYDGMLRRGFLARGWNASFMFEIQVLLWNYGWWNSSQSIPIIHVIRANKLYTTTNKCWQCLIQIMYTVF